MSEGAVIFSEKLAAGAQPEPLQEDDKDEERVVPQKERDREEEERMRKQQEQEQVMIAMHAKLMEEEQLKVREREIVIGECIVELRTVIAASQIFELELQDVVDALREAEDERRRRAEAERERLAWITFWNAKASLDRKRRGAEHAANGKQDAGAGHPHPPSGPGAATRGYKPQVQLQHAATTRTLAKSKYVSPREVRARRHVIAGGPRTRLGQAASRWDEGMGYRAVGAVAAHGEGEGGGGGRGGVHSEACVVGSDAQAAVGTRGVDGECETQVSVPGRGTDDQPGTGHSRSAGHYRSHNESHDRGPNAGSLGRDGSGSGRARGGGKTHRLWEGGAGAEKRGGGRARGKGGDSVRGGGKQDAERTLQMGLSLRAGDGGRVGLPAILTPRERALACFRGSPLSPPVDD